MAQKTIDEICKYVEEETKRFSESRMLQCTANKLSESLCISRSLASHYLNKLVKEDILVKVNTRPVCFLAKRVLEEILDINISNAEFEGPEDFFEEIFSVKRDKKDFEKAAGSNGSLSYCVMQCKSAVQYPQNGLPILLAGEVGTGKSFFAHLMYEYAVNNKILDERAPFHVLKASKQGAETDEKLLFGRMVQGKTGEMKYIPGLLQKADGGMLYIEEAENLTRTSQIQLAKYIQTSCFTPAAQDSPVKKSKVRLVFSTSRNADDIFVKDLYLHIPLTARFPMLSQRYTEEKEKLILDFFGREQKKIKRGVEISAQVFSALLDGNFSDNIDGLDKAVKNCCANAFVDGAEEQEVQSVIKIYVRHLPDEVLSNIQNISENESERPLININSCKKNEKNEKEIIFINILKRAVDGFLQYRSGQISQEQFMGIMTKLVGSYHDYFVFKEKYSNNRIKIIEGIVNKVTVEIVNKYNILIPKNYEYALSRIIYHTSQLNHVMKKWETENAEILEGILQIVKSSSENAFAIAAELDENLRRMAGSYPNKMNLICAALMIDQYNKKSVDGRYLGVILSHGYSTASSIADAANTLLGRHTFDAIDMPLNSTLEETVIRLNEHLKRRLGKKDMILLVDMGSLEEIGDVISKTMNTDIGVINNISTLAALNAGTRMNQGEEIEEIFAAIHQENTYMSQIIRKHKKTNAILVTSETGYAAAERMAELLRKSFEPSAEIEVVSHDYIDLLNNKEEADILKKYNVLFVIGTVKIQLDSTPFVFLEDMINFKNIDALNRILQNYLSERDLNHFNSNLLTNFSLENVMQSITILNPYVLLQYINEAVDTLQGNMGICLSNRTIVGIYVHSCCLIERLVTKDEYRTYPEIEAFLREHGDFIETFNRSFADVISYYKIEVPIAEIAYIYEYIENEEP